MSALRHHFTTRDDLLDYLKATFPQAAAVDPHIAETRGGRAAALQRLHQIDPVRYAHTRNWLKGAVTYLSPYIRHGVLSLAEVRDYVLAQVSNPQLADKLMYELACHDYFHRAYERLGERIWQDVEPIKTGHRADTYAESLPEDVHGGNTGLHCIDSFVRQLYTTGYLHNHARMWLAAYLIHWRRIRWQAGATWFLEHLLDGDPASNNLSWQWVASTFSQKPYLFNRENLEKYSEGVYCRECPLRGHCDFEGSYDDLHSRLFRDGDQSAEVPNMGLGRAHLRDLTTQTDGIDPAAVLVWVHGESLSPQQPALRAFPQAPAVWVWDEALLTEWRISLKRIVFMYECLLELPVTLQRGDVAAQVIDSARAQGRDQIVTTFSPSPRFQQIVAALRQGGMTIHVLPGDHFVPDRAYDLKRFSRYWRQAQPYAFDPHSF
jgi:deoxyribodipyrimidine photo-lyase